MQLIKTVRYVMIGVLMVLLYALYGASLSPLVSIAFCRDLLPAGSDLHGAYWFFATRLHGATSNRPAAIAVVPGG